MQGIRHAERDLLQGGRELYTLALEGLHEKSSSQYSTSQPFPMLPNKCQNSSDVTKYRAQQPSRPELHRVRMHIANTSIATGKQVLNPQSRNLTNHMMLLT